MIVADLSVRVANLLHDPVTAENFTRHVFGDFFVVLLAFWICAFIVVRSG